MYTLAAGVPFEFIERARVFSGRIEAADATDHQVHPRDPRAAGAHVASSGAELLDTGRRRPQVLQQFPVSPDEDFF